MSTTRNWYKPPPQLALNSLQVKMMVTRAERECQMREKQEAQMEGIQKMEEQRLQRIDKKKEWDRLRKEEEEARKRDEDKNKPIEQEGQSNLENVAAAVSPNPTDSDTMEDEAPDPAINLHLKEMMQGIEGKVEGGKDRESRTPPKQKKKASQTTPSAKTTNSPGKKAHTIIDTHVHKFPWTILDGAIKLKDANPFQEYIITLQNLLKNGQLVDSHFAFCPIKANG